MQSQDTQGEVVLTLQEQQARAMKKLQERLINPFPFYKHMRATEPVYYDSENKQWEIFRYDDVQRVVNDYATFSSERFPQERMRNQQDTENQAFRSILSMDPPRHRQLRSIISQAFTPRAIAQLTPRITSIVDEYLDKVADRGKMDIVDDLAYPLPTIVIAEMLGVPTEDREQFKHWSDAIVQTSQEATQQAFKEMREYFRQVIAQRRDNPKHDLISSLIAAEVEGKHLTDGELISFCILLLVAGNETTTNLIGNAIICLDEHPEAMDQLRADPSLMPGAVEEVLRYLSPVQLLVRATVADTVIGGRQIKAGEIVVPSLGSANRDEEQFPNADVFDIKRTPNRHVAFGHGIHFCIGAPLARLESKIALDALLARFKDIKRVREVRLEPIPSVFIYGVKHLPVTFGAR